MDTGTQMAAAGKQGSLPSGDPMSPVDQCPRCFSYDVEEVKSEESPAVAQLSQLRTFFGFFALIFVVRPCVFIVAL
jgi:hypothetical protein